MARATARAIRFAWALSRAPSPSAVSSRSSTDSRACRVSPSAMNSPRSIQLVSRGNRYGRIEVEKLESVAAAHLVLFIFGNALEVLLDDFHRVGVLRLLVGEVRTPNEVVDAH